MNEYPKYTVERLDFTEEIRGETNKKTFYIDEPQPNGNQLVILSFGNEKVIMEESKKKFMTKILDLLSQLTVY